MIAKLLPRRDECAEPGWPAPIESLTGAGTPSPFRPAAAPTRPFLTRGHCRMLIHAGARGVAPGRIPFWRLCILRVRIPALFGLLVLSTTFLRPMDPRTLPLLGYHPDGIAYWSEPYFANALAAGHWIEFADWEWGDDVEPWGNPQFDGNGFPRYLNPGKNLRAVVWGLHCVYGNRPPTWPLRNGPAMGHVVLAWRGEADIRLQSGTYLRAESSGEAEGLLADGRRVYRFEGGDWLMWLEVHAINPDRPVADIKVWLPDPADPAHQSLEGVLFHPLLLDRLRDPGWGCIRFMAWEETNGNPQQDWADRRLPAHCFQTGVLNPRNPAPGVDWVGGNRGSGAAFEHMVALCNASGRDLWICVPHLATDDFAARLARLIRYGSDGVQPYAGPQSAPLYPPLDPGLRVYVEYSNEIWSGGWSFPQGEWADVQAAAQGISKAEFNARRFCEIWRIFQEVFGGTERLVRVAAVFTAADWYTGPFLAGMREYGATLSPAVEPDVIAVTTYFGNGIQDWAHARAEAAAGTSDPWFYTGEHFDDGGLVRSVALPAGDPYWVGEDIARHLGETFDTWTGRILSGSALEGAGPDAVGTGGGFDPRLREMARTVFATPKPIVAYEGGPSIYTDDKDGSDMRDDGLTTFMEALNRHPRMREVYGIHLNMARARGLWTHNGFTDCGACGKYGQWGHLEHLDQDPSTAVKYSFLMDWASEFAGLRHLDDPTGAVPRFDTPADLPTAYAGVPYEATIASSGGDGARTAVVIGRILPAGLDCAVPPETPDEVEIRGTPQADGPGYAYARVVDADGDPAWRTFSLRVTGAPGTLAEADFRGEDPALHQPWVPVLWLAAGCGYSGWSGGAGVTPREGDGAFNWSVDAPGEEYAHTLDLAVAGGQCLSVTVAPPPGVALDLRGAEIRLIVRRIDWHAPRQYAFFAGPSGFAAGQEVYTSGYLADSDEHELRFSLPASTAYAAVSGPVEFRLCGFQAQWAGHRASLREFRLKNPVRPGDADGNGWVDGGDAVRLGQYLAGNTGSIAPAGADVNGDLKIGVVDLVLLRRLASGGN